MGNKLFQPTTYFRRIHCRSDYTQSMITLQQRWDSDDSEKQWRNIPDVDLSYKEYLGAITNYTIHPEANKNKGE